MEPLEEVPDGAWTPGLICLKGGDLTAEAEALKASYPETAGAGRSLDGLLGPDWADKRIIHVTA